MKEKKIEEIRERARKNFSLGYNCAECVVESVLSLVDTGLPPEVKKVATGFGGGVGLYGDTLWGTHRSRHGSGGSTWENHSS
ncbi:MAG: C-GCAxxG-C-C family protein [Deltaproteobacteria bacterium]|nr:C-GCAxxG-C-C family protein [Deltaproteobacteria bacterium]